MENGAVLGEPFAFSWDTHAGSNAFPTLPASDPTASGVACPLPTEELRTSAAVEADILQRSAALLELVSRVSSINSPENACKTLADEIRLLYDLRYVIVGLCERKRGGCDIVAISETQQIDSNAELTLRATAAARECLARGGQGLWPAVDPENRHSLFAHRQLAQLLEDAAVLSIPLADAQARTRGVCLLVGEPQLLASQELRSFLDAGSTPLGSALGLIQRSRGNRFDRLASRISDYCRSQMAKVGLLITLLVACGLMLPIQYQVVCDCELQPVTRRFIAAPFDARLERNFVEPGDLVQAGQILAQIDARDIQWELSGKQAELHRVAKESAGYIALHESGKAEMAKFEMARLQLTIEQLEERAFNLEIRSPLEGMVLIGDHSKLEGVPLEKGKTLFEIAPLDRMVIEVEIPEDDVRFVLPGMSTQVRLAAFPLQRFDGTIERVHPRAELREHKNVFIAEVNCDNSNGQLRPGMRGTARVASVRRNVAWNWFHKAYAATLMWLGW
jgi:hypothetical protein